MRLSLLCLSIFIAVYSFVASAQTTLDPVQRRQQLNSLLTEYSKRFLNGKYVSNKNQIQSFNALQDALAAELKKSGNLKPVLTVTNDYEKALTINLYAFIDEKNTFVGFFHEKSYYYDEEERSYLRFSNQQAIDQGLKFIPVNGSHAVIVKGHYFTPEKGGTIQVSYLKDLQENQWGAVNLFLLNRGSGWSFFNLQYVAVTKAFVRAWSSIFPPNGGVREIVIQ